MKISIREEGVTEVSGTGNNPRILEYHATTSLDPADAGNDSTPWCSSFVNWCIEQAGEEGTDSAVARSWDGWQKELISPRVGCIVVFSRKGKGTNGGHVGFYLSERDTDIEILGGNQKDKVTRSFYPKNGRKGLYQYRLLSYRWTT